MREEIKTVRVREKDVPDESRGCCSIDGKGALRGMRWSERTRPQRLKGHDGRTGCIYRSSAHFQPTGTSKVLRHST